MNTHDEELPPKAHPRRGKSVIKARRAVANLAVTLLLAFSLVSCSVGPKYRAPTTPLAPLHNTDGIASRKAASAAPPLDTWWTGFEDPVLTRIVQRSLDQNLDLAAALARVDQARAVALQAGAQLKPSGNVSGSVSPIHASLASPIGSVARNFPGYKRDLTDFQVGAGATWEIDLSGGLRHGKEAAIAEAQAADAQRLGTRIFIAADAADAYFQIRGNQARLAVARDQIAVDQHLLSLVRQRYDAGVATVREVAQAEAVVSQAKTTIPPLLTSIEAQSNRLDVLMGAQPGTYAVELVPVGGEVIVPAIAGFSEPAELLRRRPDVIAAERRLAASNAAIGIAIAEYYPKVSLSGLLGFESISATSLLKASAFQPAAVAGIHWRLFDFGKVDALVAQRRGANAEALVAYRLTVLRATEDVENAFMALAQAEARIDELLRETDALKRARDSSQEAYTSGVISITDVLDADRQLLAAHDDLAATRAVAARAAVGSFRALGGGWTP